MPAFLLLLAADLAVVAVVALYTWPLGWPLQGAVLGAVALLGLAGAFVSRATLKARAAARLNAELVPEPRSSAEMWLINAIERLSRAAGISVPQVAIYRGAAPNALGVGAARDDAMLALSSGLLAGLPQDEVEAVLAHAVGSIADGGAATLALGQGVIDTFVRAPARTIGGAIDRMGSKGAAEGETAPGPGYRAVAFVLQLAFGFLATLIVSAYARSRRPRGDARAAHLAGRRKIKSALERLQTSEAPTLAPDLAGFAVRAKSDGPFGTQPTPAARLAALPPA